MAATPLQVLVSLAAAGRDPARYPDAETLDVDRAGATHLAFGHGVHQQRIRATMTSKTSAIGVDVASDKSLTNRLLARVASASGQCVTWADRDLVRSAVPFWELPTCAAELSYGLGARVPGGFFHTLLWGVLLAVTVANLRPAVPVGVPLISPVVLLIVSPAGKLEAV